MISENSALLRLPAELVNRQKVLFDGLRHAAQISWVAFKRLDAALTWLVDSQPEDPNWHEVQTEAFLDAWALVDAIDRFRSLWNVHVGKNVVVPPGKTAFRDLSLDVRNVRNVTDHLDTRLDYVAAHGSPTMGAITWCTLDRNSKTRFKTCVLTAGTAKKGMWQFVNPAGLDLFTGPSGRTCEIHIAAGEHRANLSKIIPAMETRVRDLEKGLEAEFQRLGLEGKQAGADFFIALAGEIDESTNTMTLR